MEEELAQEIRNLITTIKEDRKGNDDIVLDEVKSLHKTMIVLLKEIKLLHKSVESLKPEPIYKERNKPENIMNDIRCDTKHLKDVIDQIKNSADTIESNTFIEDQLDTLTSSVSHMEDAVEDNMMITKEFSENFNPAELSSIPENLETLTNTLDELELLDNISDINNNTSLMMDETTAINDAINDSILYQMDENNDQTNSNMLNIISLLEEINSDNNNMINLLNENNNNSYLNETINLNNDINENINTNLTEGINEIISLLKEIINWIGDTQELIDSCTGSIIRSMPY